MRFMGRRAWLVTLWLALFAVPLWPNALTLDYLGTCNLDPGWTHEDGVRLTSAFPDQVQVGTPFVLTNAGGGYLMAYAAGNGSWDGIHGSSSLDGLTWSNGLAPILNASDFGLTNLLEPFLVVMPNGTMYAYLEGWNAFQSDPPVGAIYRATSVDGGVTWGADGVAFDGNPGALFPASPVVEHVDALGILRMYYTGLNMTTNRRGLFVAESVDGISWIKRGLVMAPGGLVDQNGPMRIALNQERGLVAYRLYYSEYRREDKILTAISADGQAWIKDRVVLTKGPTDQSDLNITSPFVITSGWGEARMYFMANGQTDPTYRIFSAHTRAANTDPVVVAGDPQTVQVGTLVTVNGSASFDPNPDTLNVTWFLVTWPSGSSPSLTDPYSLVTTFFADWPGIFGIVLAIFDDCGGLTFGYTIVVAVNDAPVASASAWPGTTLPVASMVTLDSANSTDLEGGALNYLWSIVSQPLASTVTLADPYDPVQTFLLDALGDFTFSLDATDPYGANSTDSLTLTAINRAPAPVISVTPAGQVISGTPVIFDASGSIDPDGHALSYVWQLASAPAGSAASLTVLVGNSTTLTPDLAGVYVATVNVSDPWGGLSSFPAVVVATNTPPVALVTVSPTSTVALNDPVTLNASSSFDPDGHPFTLAWSILSAPPGGMALLTNTTGPETGLTPDVEGTYSVQLIVTDAYGGQSQGFAAVTGVATPPFADAGNDQTVLVGNVVALDGSLSQSPSGQPLTFFWAFLLRPPASSAALSNASASVANFVPDIVGSYIVELDVVDPASSLNSADAVVVSAVNDPPTVTACCDAVQDIGTAAPVVAIGTDADPGHVVTYAWDFLSKPVGSTAAFADPTSNATAFLVDRVGAYLVRVIVADPYGAESSAIVTILSNRPPRTLAIVQPADVVLIGTTVILDGTNSYDPDGDAIALGWSLMDWPGRTGGAPPPALQISGGVLTVDATYLGTFSASLSAMDTYGSSANLTVTFSSYNSPPLAITVCEPTVPLGQNVTCTAAGSIDPDAGHTVGLTFRWTSFQSPLGATVSFSNALGVSTEVSMDRIGNYTLVLTATDVWGGTESDTILVVVTNAPPVADAGDDEILLLDDGEVRVTLDGTGSHDDDGHDITFFWAVSTAGIPTTLTNPNTATPFFSAVASGRYVLTLIVTDEFGLSSTDLVSVTVNLAPTARAGLDREVIVDERTLLDASGSFDPDGAIAVYEWLVTSQPSGSDYQMTGNRTATPTFTANTPGTYEITLRVTDDLGGVSTDIVVLNVGYPPDLFTPLALAVLGASLIVVIGYTVYRRQSVVIEDLFLLAHDGVLIKHYTRRLRPGSDSDILSAMLVAVQNFVDDAFKGIDVGALPLEQFKFGGQTMLIAKGKYLFLAALVSGPNPSKVLNKISETLKHVEKEMGHIFKTWKGDMSLVAEADDYMDDLLGIKRRK